MQRKFLESLPDDPVKTITYCVYMSRIQKRINKELEMLKWLTVNRPDIFLLETTKINDTTGKIVSHNRMKTLLLCLKHLHPHCDVELTKREDSS